MKSAIILAGGSGTRTGWDIPKQFVEIMGIPMIVYSLKEFEKNSYIDEMIIVCNKNYVELLKKIIDDYKIIKKAIIVDGGDTHQESLFNALNYCFINRENNDDIVCIHNANRPLITQEIIDDSIKKCINYGNGISAIYSVDSLMLSADGKTSNQFVNRDNIVRAQSPQSYKTVQLYDVYSKAKKDKIKNSYECDLMTRYGYSIYFSKGLEENIKLTVDKDLYLIESILEKRKKIEEQSNINRIQKNLEEILDYIFKLCRENNLTCYLAYGTLLGAARHKGFIPWDNDVDLMMTIKDYKKLEKILLNSKNECYFVQNYNTDRNYGLNWMKIRKNNTTLLDKRWKNIEAHPGIDVDIFQISRVPNNLLIRKIWLVIYRIQWALLESIIVENNVKELKNKNKKTLYKLLIKVPYFVRKAVINILDPIAFGRGTIKTKNVIVGTKKVYYPYDLFKEKTTLLFNGKQYDVPKDYKDFLDIRYGANWNELPPYNKRHNKKIAILDFEHQLYNPIKP